MLDLDRIGTPIKLCKGPGGLAQKEACWMSAISYYEGGKWSDHPACVCREIRSVCVSLNDAIPDHLRGEIIGPHLYVPVGTADATGAESAERWKLVEDYEAVVEKHSTRVLGRYMLFDTPLKELRSTEVLGVKVPQWGWRYTRTPSDDEFREAAKPVIDLIYAMAAIGKKTEVPQERDVRDVVCV